MWLFIGGSGHAIFTPPLLIFFLLTQPVRNVASAEILLPPRCSHLCRNTSSLPPDAADCPTTDPPTSQTLHLLILSFSLVRCCCSTILCTSCGHVVSLRGMKTAPRRNLHEITSLGFEKTEPVGVEELKLLSLKFKGSSDCRQISSLHLTHHLLTPSSQSDVSAEHKRQRIQFTHTTIHTKNLRSRNHQ